MRLTHAIVIAALSTSAAFAQTSVGGTAGGTSGTSSSTVIGAPTPAFPPGLSSGPNPAVTPSTQPLAQPAPSLGATANLGTTIGQPLPGTTGLSQQSTLTQPAGPTGTVQQPGLPQTLQPIPGTPGTAQTQTAQTQMSQAQVQSRLSSLGYSNIAGLTMDGNGAWHGVAQRNGQSVTIALDSRGNLTAE